MKNYLRSVITLAIFAIAITGFAQTIAVPTVFIDCQGRECFEFYLKQEVTYINYVRDRQVADVYVLVTDQSASAGSREVQMAFSFAPELNLPEDTITYYREANISDLDRQNQFVDNFNRGVLPYLLKTELAKSIKYEVETDSTQDLALTPLADPWNYWSIDIGLNLDISGETSFQEQGYFSRISASRITADSKTFMRTWYNYQQSKFTLSDGEVVESINRRLGLFGQHVWSIGDHWSWGGRLFTGSSTFGNVDVESSARVGIEYNFYPYSDNSTRRFSIRYMIGAEYKDYTEITVFDKLNETRGRHGIDVEYNQNQKWGSLSFDIEFDQYLHDFSLYSISFNPNIELNLVKGLSLEFGGFISFVGDRINIAKGDVSDQDIILQNRQLDTSYSYFSYFGFNYRFGSQNNTIVNPRF